jgi:RNA polymerase sigma-70 factor (ECF subfamily)
MFSRRQAPASSNADLPTYAPGFAERLERAKRGDSEALSALYRQFLPRVFGTIAAHVPDRATAEDLTSEVFLKMVEGIRRVHSSGEAGFAAWIFQIARLTIASYYRKLQRQPSLLPMDAALWGQGEQSENYRFLTGASDVDPAHLAETRDEWSGVVRAIHALTEEQRQVLVARLIFGYDIATVAQMVGKTANAVKALEFRALRALRSKLTRSTQTEAVLATENR